MLASSRGTQDIGDGGRHYASWNDEIITLHRLCSRSAVLLSLMPIILNHPARVQGSRKYEQYPKPTFAHFLSWFFPRGLHVLQLAYSVYFEVLNIASTGSPVLLSYPPMDGSRRVWTIDFGFIAEKRWKQHKGSKYGGQCGHLVRVSFGV